MTKVDAGSFNAFSSPNLPPLANAEVDIKSKQFHRLSPVIYDACKSTLPSSRAVSGFDQYLHN